MAIVAMLAVSISKNIVLALDLLGGRLSRKLGSLRRFETVHAQGLKWIRAALFAVVILLASKF